MVEYLLGLLPALARPFGGDGCELVFLDLLDQIEIMAVAFVGVGELVEAAIFGLNVNTEALVLFVERLFFGA